MCVSNKSPWTSNALDSGAECGEPLMWPIAVRGSDFIGTPRGHGLPYCLCQWILRSGWKEIVPFPELLKPPWSLKISPGENHCPPEPLKVTPGIAPSGPLGWKKIENKLLVFLSVSPLPPIRFYSGTTDPKLAFLWKSSWSPWNTWLRDLMTRVPLLPVHTNSVCTLDCALATLFCFIWWQTLRWVLRWSLFSSLKRDCHLLQVKSQDSNASLSLLGASLKGPVLLHLLWPFCSFRICEGVHCSV